MTICALFPLPRLRVFVLIHMNFPTCLLFIHTGNWTIEQSMVQVCTVAQLSSRKSSSMLVRLSLISVVYRVVYGWSVLKLAFVLVLQALTIRIRDKDCHRLRASTRIDRSSYHERYNVNNTVLLAVVIRQRSDYFG